MRPSLSTEGGKLLRISLGFTLGLAMGLAALWLLGYQPFEALETIVSAAFGSTGGWRQTLRWWAPLCIIALSVAVSFRAGIFNIGAQGQFYVGAMGAAVVGAHLPQSSGSLLPIVACGLTGALCGLLWALVPALLRAYAGVNEVVGTLLMNFIALQTCGYLARVVFPGKSNVGSLLATETLPEHARYPEISSGGLPTVPVIIAIVLTLGTTIYMKSTVSGYEDSIAGRNPHFARYTGINLRVVAIRTFLISGALAGVAGAVEVQGNVGRFVVGFNPNIGFIAVLVALVGLTAPPLVAASALLFGGMASAGQQLRLVSGLPESVVIVLQGCITVFITAQFVRPRLRASKASTSNDLSPQPDGRGVDRG